MSQSPYSNWPAAVKTEQDPYAAMPPPRRSGSGDQGSLGYASYHQGDAQRHLQSRAGMRPHSSSTSSLSGAMGDPQVSVHPRTSNTPPSGLASWTHSPTTSNPYMAGVPDDLYLGPGIASSSTGAFGHPYGGMPMYPSPETSPSYNQFAASAMVISPSVTPAPRQSHSPQNKDEEIRRLQQRIRELEIVAESERRRVRQLEAEVSRGGVYASPLPSPPTPQGPPSFQQEWNARTEARKKLYCSLNRAGNALCAWHDSRRERREFPPRMAPPGMLNCGCTYKEALFEESLSRHEVGRYRPGEGVRMDPALRNPLLKLLEQRYGYQDGDFERDPITGNWIEGEGAAYWEQQVASGATIRRRQESERR